MNRHDDDGRHHCILTWTPHHITTRNIFVSDSKHFPCCNWKTGNGWVWINYSSHSSLLNHCPAVIWKYSHCWLYGCFGAMRDFFSMGVFYENLKNRPGCGGWSEDRDRQLILLTLTGQSILQHKVRRLVNTLQLSTWNRSKRQEQD